MFGRRPPIFVAFDVLVDRGEDVLTLRLARRKAVLRRPARGARRWIAITDGVPGRGRRLFDLVAEMEPRGHRGEAPRRPLRARSDDPVEDPQPVLLAEGCAIGTVRARGGRW